jgi:GTP-binding protein
LREPQPEAVLHFKVARLYVAQFLLNVKFNTIMIFVDEAKIIVQAGNGGHGCESYHRDKFHKHPIPNGGDGGKGGDVLITASRSIQTLLDYKYKQHYKADNGGHGSSRGKKGRDGKLCNLHVPQGTIIRDDTTGMIIRDLVDDGQSIVIAKGGRGGIGNERRRATLPAEPGEERRLRLELKVIADVGLIGFPNAGKSTLINAISSVKSKIANYPFTTKQPVLGIVKGGDDQPNIVVADLPGIIEGAHEGKGLGYRFLRHAERTRVLVHVLDMGSTEGRDPLEDFEKLNSELSLYSDNMLLKQKINVANKMDVDGAKENLQRFRSKYKQEIIPVSAVEKTGLDDLINKIRSILCQDNYPAL